MTTEDLELLDFEEQCQFNVEWPGFDLEAL